MLNRKLVYIVSLMFVLLILPNLLYSQERKSYILVGFSLGEPTGILGRWQMNPNHGIEVNLGATLLSPFFNDAESEVIYDTNKMKFNIGASYIMNIFLTRQWNLPMYFGAGVNFKFESNTITRFGIKFPNVGIEKIFRYGSLRWGLFADFGLITNLTPEGQSLFDWIISIVDDGKDSYYHFYNAFDIHFTIGARFYIPT